MPVISFSISESLRKFLKKLVQGNYYKNNSLVMRDALSRLMNSYSDTDDLEISMNADEVGDNFTENVIGNIMLIIDKYDESVEKKVSKIEFAYNDSIKAKHCFYYSDTKSLIYVFDGKIDNFQAFITEMNKIEELKNIRYILI